MKPAILYAETLAVLLVVAIAARYLAGLDWPWATFVGAAAAVLLRAVLSRKSVASRDS